MISSLIRSSRGARGLRLFTLITSGNCFLRVRVSWHVGIPLDYNAMDDMELHAQVVCASFLSSIVEALVVRRFPIDGLMRTDCGN